VTPSDILGAVGVAILLAAYVLNAARYVPIDSLAYQAANAIGASLACIASAIIGFVPFVVLEGIWAAVAITAIVRRRVGEHEADARAQR
jgi:hypothetical protein